MIDQTRYHWTAESWGSDYPPANWEDIASAANDRIDSYIADNDPDEDALADFCDKLWTAYCLTADTIDAGLFDAAVELMDDEIREQVHADLAPCTDWEFLNEYERRHLTKFGTPFKI